MFVDSLAALAHADVVGRTGATELQVGYLRDGVPADEADWWATAQYRGVKVTVQNYPGPVEALEALATRLLTGGQCTWCHMPVTVAGTPDTPTVHRNPVANGPQPPVAGQCRWRREGSRWVRGCETDPPVPTG